MAKLGQDIDREGWRAIQQAIRGGEGSEFARLVLPQVPNWPAILTGFQLGLIREYVVRGAVVKSPKLLPTFQGGGWDQLNAQAAAAVILNNRRMEFGAILRGPIDAPIRSVYVFGIDRGGATQAPVPGLPDHRLDALVTVVREANGAVSGSVKDLDTGQETALRRRDIRIKGSTLRVFVKTGQLPSTGASLDRYQFAFAVRNATEGGIETVASVTPGTGTIRVGDLRRRRV
jgi:hypothetical protein